VNDKDISKSGNVKSAIASGPTNHGLPSEIDNSALPTPSSVINKLPVTSCSKL
jgi:hypothetical protein